MREVALLVLCACVEPGFKAIQLPVNPDRVPIPEIGVDTGFPGRIATEPMYIHTADTLFSLDAKTLQPRRVGTFSTADGGSVSGMGDIAIDPSGRLYGSAGSQLYRIDPVSAEAEFICPLPTGPVALAFDSDGTLYIGDGARVSRVDVFTCVSSGFRTQRSFSTSGDLVGLPDGYLYWTVRGTGGDDLVRVDPQTGDTVLIGSLGVGSIWGLGFELGDLYGFTAGGLVLKIEPESGSVEPVADLGLSWWGATTNPVVWE